MLTKVVKHKTQSVPLFFYFALIVLTKIPHSGGVTKPTDIRRHLKTIYRYNATGQAWEIAGKMTKRRGFTAVTVLQDVYKWCE